MCESNQGSLRTFVSPFDMSRSFRSSDGSKYRGPADGMPVVVVHRPGETRGGLSFQYHPGLPFRILILGTPTPVIARAKLKPKADDLPWNFTSRSTPPSPPRRDRSDGAPDAG